MNLPEPPRPVTWTKYGKMESIGGQVVFAALAIGAFVAGFLLSQGWHWVGIGLVIMIPLWARSVQGRYLEEREALRNWPLVEAKLLQVQNIAPQPGSVLVLTFSYEWQGATVKGELKVTALTSAIDLYQPIWLLVNPRNPTEHWFLPDFKLVEIDLNRLASTSVSSEDVP